MSDRRLPGDQLWAAFGEFTPGETALAVSIPLVVPVEVAMPRHRLAITWGWVRDAVRPVPDETAWLDTPAVDVVHVNGATSADALTLLKSTTRPTVLAQLVNTAVGAAVATNSLRVDTLPEAVESAVTRWAPVLPGWLPRALAKVDAWWPVALAQLRMIPDARSVRGLCVMSDDGVS